jgi:hypothetical protein
MRWADVFRAEELKKRWTDDEVTITNRWNLYDGYQYDVIHFLYSGALSNSKDYILEHKDRVFTSLVSQRSLDGMWDDKKELFEIYRETRMCVCQNKGLLAQLKDLIPGVRATYIPNGVDEKLFDQKFVAGFVGAKDSNDHKGLSLSKKACEDLGIELIEAHEHHYTHEEMPEFYKKINCLIIPSLSEGCHNPTLEALAMNIPVISTRVGIAEDLYGVTIVDRDVESISEALRQLSGRIQILKEYTWDLISKQYHNLYVEKQGTP